MMYARYIHTYIDLGGGGGHHLTSMGLAQARPNYKATYMYMYKQQKSKGETLSSSSSAQN